MKYNIAEIEFHQKWRETFNKQNLHEMEFYDKQGNLIHVRPEAIEDFRFTGLSNLDFILSGWYLSEGVL